MLASNTFYTCSEKPLREKSAKTRPDVNDTGSSRDNSYTVGAIVEDV